MKLIERPDEVNKYQVSQFILAYTLPMVRLSSFASQFSVWHVICTQICWHWQQCLVGSFRDLFVGFFYSSFQLLISSSAFAVVNLTLIDLPGLTKVAVGTSQIDMSFWSLILRQISGSSSVFVFMTCMILIDFYCEITEGQPDSIVHDIENMVRSFIEKVVSIQVLKLLVRNNMFKEQTFQAFYLPALNLRRNL